MCPRWKGNKARELGEGYKLFYSGTNDEGRNGVGIILNEELTSCVVSVNRRNDRIMTMKLDSDVIINVVCAYAPQVGCDDEVKDQFWNELKEEVDSIPKEERVIIGADLNGHVGQKENEIRGRVHGGWSVGGENDKGRRIVDFALASDFILANTFFKKPDNQLVTYKSGGNTSQIDFIMYRRQNIKEVKNCKVINGESVTSQHRIVVMDCDVSIVNKRKKRNQESKKVKWWTLKDPIIQDKYKTRVLENIKEIKGVQEWWRENGNVIKETANNVLGRTTGKRAPNDKESWWWNQEVQNAVKLKKVAKTKYDKQGQMKTNNDIKKLKKRQREW